MRAFTLIALAPFVLGQQYMLNLNCADYPGPCNNDCYAAYVANKPLVWKNRLPQEDISALTSVLRPLTTMAPMASLTDAGERLVAFPLPHVPMAGWQCRVLRRTPVTNILTRPLSKAVAEQFFGAPS
jgi:hypothetical protein